MIGPRRSLGSFVSLALVVACGAGCGSSPPPTAPTDVPVAARAGGPNGRGNDVAGAASTGSRRGASDALKQAWPFETPKVVVYADFGGLMRTALMTSVTKGLVTMLATVDATAPQKKCVDDVVANVQELAFGSDGEDALLVARVDPAATAWVGTCLVALSPNIKPTTIAGATGAWEDKKEVTAVSANGIVVLGGRDVVQRALGSHGSGASLASVTLGAGEYMTWSAAVFDDGRPVTGSIVATDERFRIAGEGDAPNAKVAEMIERQLGGPGLTEQLRAVTGMRSDEQRALAKVVEAFSVKRDGRHVAIAFELREPPADQAKDLGALAALGIYGVRKYISNAKQAEAKNVIGQLAKDVVTEWESERPDGKPRSKKKLVSYGPVPKTVPKGAKYQSSDADWKPFAPIRFSMTVPQYYQYEIKAAKDGESAEIIARGDLNGDGKTSQFKLLIKVDRSNDSLRISPSIQETEPDE